MTWNRKKYPQTFIMCKFFDLRLENWAYINLMDDIDFISLFFSVLHSHMQTIQLQKEIYRVVFSNKCFNNGQMHENFKVQLK